MSLIASQVELGPSPLQASHNIITLGRREGVGAVEVIPAKPEVIESFKHPYNKKRWALETPKVHRSVT